jgi:hypothetical protein
MANFFTSPEGMKDRGANRGMGVRTTYKAA